MNAGLKGLDGVFGVLVKVVAEDDGVQTGMDELVKIALSYAGRKILPQKKQFPSLAEEDENAEAVITSRFLYIEKICQNYVTKPRENKARNERRNSLFVCGAKGIFQKSFC